MSVDGATFTSAQKLSARKILMSRYSKFAKFQIRKIQALYSMMYSYLLLGSFVLPEELKTKQTEGLADRKKAKSLEAKVLQYETIMRKNGKR